jgi:hypothetical protein
MVLSPEHPAVTKGHEMSIDQHNRKCACCGQSAEIYGGGLYAGDWADYYCFRDLPHGFVVFARLEVSA